jgi:predicted GNAT family acetyltransferase
MLVEQEENGTKGAFYVSDKGNRLAELSYSLTPGDILIINHTEVDESLKGKNVGYLMVSSAVAYAREKHLKIFPLCPFARSVFEKKKEEFADVIK